MEARNYPGRYLWVKTR